MCAALMPWAKWLAFSGLVLTTIAGLLLTSTATKVYKWISRFEIQNTFNALKKIAAKHEALERATTIPPLLVGSEIVSDRLNSKRNGGLFGLAPARYSLRRAHDKIRKNLNLSPQAIEKPAPILRTDLIELSHKQVREALERSLDNTVLSENRYFKLAVWTFIIGSCLQLVASWPSC
ncbi:hypothetical protein [Brucella endophytica]|uniref:hypothetical protein n=1 Tax=Brucella endophytica TaxID=1963359 RepID=UPI00166B3E58|nr:hypothetical protein [Brucella endophytica]